MVIMKLHKQRGLPMNNILQISVENNLVIARFNGEGEGNKYCGYVSEEQVQNIIDSHNQSEKLSPSSRNAKAVRV